MPLFRIFPVLVLLLPLVEIFLFVEVGGLLGAGWTILEVLGTAVAGLVLLRRLGMENFRRTQEALRSGEPPLFGMLDTTLLATGGVLLIVPGFFTDAVGLLLVVPLLRGFVIRRMLSSIRTNREREDGVIEGNYHIESEEKKE
ncbi:MAG: FxsA family protein [Hyphomicrobiales bacterium]|nr:FxsA family protein [Hyphomicrobiales bacterium]MCY4049023.1 FxsA family protein [Hyphomicrobiales bacterium]MCY4053429.1 FxsA family protein [Hyphomicrobiales bacterium]